MRDGRVAAHGGKPHRQGARITAEARQAVLAEVATLYWIDKLNQEQIARQIGRSVPTVSRLLAEAETTGIVEVRGWDNLRNVIGRSPSATTTPAAPCTGSAIAASFTLTNPAIIEPVMNPDGITLASVISSGGGWGHNVGMSQYGAHGRGLAGQNFLQILKSYYQGVDIGSYPITVSRARNNPPPTILQRFWAPNALGTLVVRPTADMKRLIVRVNGNQFNLGPDNYNGQIYSRDISSYLVTGLNTIEYDGISRNGGATVNVNVY